MNDPIRDALTSNILAWNSDGAANMQHSQDEETAADTDEPPDSSSAAASDFKQFKRNIVRKHAEPSQSLLTKALQQPEDITPQLTLRGIRRRSMNSNMSQASTADLTSDTGLTSPARSNTPSPPPPVITLSSMRPRDAAAKSINVPQSPAANVSAATDKPKPAATEAAPKKRCISFACGPKPQPKANVEPPKAKETEPAPARVSVAEEKPQRKPCIKFACPSKPTVKPATTSPPAREQDTTPTAPRAINSPFKEKESSPSSVRKYRSPSVGRGRAHRSSTPRPASKGSIGTPSKKYLSADGTDLDRESSRFHEFASDDPQEDDWIRLNQTASGRRLTINDTLQKENEIRRLGKEAEEEEEEELDDEDEQEDDNVDNEDNDEDEDADDDEDDDGATVHNNEDDGVDVDDTLDVEDDLSGYGSDEDYSDGYKTDEEVGFADSDDEEGCDLELWTPGNRIAQAVSSGSPISRRPSLAGHKSDSSISDIAVPNASGRGRRRRIQIEEPAAELPDSTDFVCGTLDEDRPLEEAYMTRVAAKRREKLHVIPQDIDPSFPTSEPEDGEEQTHKGGHESDEHVWIHGELEDLHHDKIRDRRNKKQPSPKRYRSPPPKRHVSPPPKNRGRSPRRLFDRHSPRRFGSPAPVARVRSPPASLIQANPRPHFNTALAFHPGLTHTKSLPRAPAMFPAHFKNQRRSKMPSTTDTRHIRGAIDIVKGLEKKRQRRKEKFKEKNYQKHCDRARKGRVTEKRPQPGIGAERMREIGLAGKSGQGKFVLSV